MTDELPLHLLTPRSCRMARAGLGIYQDELARAAGVHKRTVKMFETGQAQPVPKTATGIMTALIDRGVAFGFDGSIRIDGVATEPGTLPPEFQPPKLQRIGAEAHPA